MAASYLGGLSCLVVSLACVGVGFVCYIYTYIHTSIHTQFLFGEHGGSCNSHAVAGLPVRLMLSKIQKKSTSMEIRENQCSLGRTDHDMEFKVGFSGLDINDGQWREKQIWNDREGPEQSQTARSKNHFYNKQKNESKSECLRMIYK